MVEELSSSVIKKQLKEISFGSKVIKITLLSITVLMK